MKAMIRNAAVLALVLAATTASAGRRCPKGYILNDDDVCVPVNPPPPSCTYPASDGSCLTVTKDATGHISKITGTGKDGIWRTVEYTQHNYVGQPEGLMTGCNPPDAQHDGPWGCIGFSDLDSNWVSMTYTDGRNNWLRSTISTRPQLAGASFVIQNQSSRVAVSALGNVWRGGWSTAVMNVNYQGWKYQNQFDYNVETRQSTLPTTDWTFAFPEVNELKFFDGALPPPPESGWGVRGFGDGVIGLAVGVGVDVLTTLEASAAWPILVGIVGAIAWDYWQNTPAVRDKTGEVFTNPLCAAARAMDDLDAVVEGNVPINETFFHALGCVR